jgi:hypothetical protein
VWVILSDDQRLGTESSVIIDYLERIGHRLDALEIPGSSQYAIEAAAGYLYDLSDPTQLAMSASGTHPIPQDAMSASNWVECYGVMAPD